MSRADHATALRQKCPVGKQAALELDIDDRARLVRLIQPGDVLLAAAVKPPSLARGAPRQDGGPRIELSQPPGFDRLRREVEAILDRAGLLGNEPHKPPGIVQILRCQRRDESRKWEDVFQNQKPPLGRGLELVRLVSSAPPDCRQGRLRPTELPRYTSTRRTPAKSSSKRTIQEGHRAVSRLIRSWRGRFPCRNSSSNGRSPEPGR